MPKKTIQIDILDLDCRVQIETKGFEGKGCVEESEWIKHVLGEEQSRVLTPVYFKKGNQLVKKHLSICG